MKNQVKTQEMDCLYHVVKQFSSVSPVSMTVIIEGDKQSSKQQQHDLKT